MKLGDITRESRETFKGDKTGIPIVGLEHLIPQELTFSAYDVDTDNTFTKMFHKGQILFGRRRAYLKKAAVAEFDGICSGDITVIEAIPGKVDKDLLPFIIQNDALFDYAVSRSAGGLSPRVKWEQLSDYEINLPPIEDQKVLADKLWAAYRLKEGYKKLLCATDEMVKSQFIEMFGNPVTNTKGWKTAKIKDVAPEMPSKEQLSGKIWLLNLDMIESNTGRIIEKVYEDVENALSVQSFDEGNVLFSKLRPYLNKVVIPDEPGMATTELVPLRPEPSKLHKVFLSHLLRGNQFVNYANDIAGGTKMPRMPLTELRNFDCILPPMDKQLEFVFIAEQVDKSKFGDFKSQFIEMFSKYPSETPWHKLLTIINGKVYPEEYNDIGTYPICGSAGVMYYGEKKLCDANTIILGRKGNINRPIYMESDYWIVDTAFCLDVNKSILHPKYFYYWCCQYDFTKLNKQGVLPSLTRKDLEKIEMSVPPMAEQKKFVSIAEQADKSKSYVRIALKNLESILGYCIRQVA
jgi:type I restriction enzyme S subunit